MAVGARECPHCGAVDKGDWGTDTAGYEGIDLPAERPPFDPTRVTLPENLKPRWTREVVLKGIAILMIVLIGVLSVVGLLFVS